MREVCLPACLPACLIHLKTFTTSAIFPLVSLAGKFGNILMEIYGRFVTMDRQTDRQHFFKVRVVVRSWSYYVYST